MMSETLNVESMWAFRQFKDTDSKSIPSDLKPLLLALNTIPVCTAEYERGFS